MLGLRELANDPDLQAAIRQELTTVAPPGPNPQTVASTINSLNIKVRKLLDLYYAERISAETFATEEQRLTSQINALRAEAAHAQTEAKRRDELVNRFDRVAEVLGALEVGTIWEEATEAERRTLLVDLVDSVHFYPDQITVQVVGAPPILVTLAEVGLRGWYQTCRVGGGT